MENGGFKEALERSRGAQCAGFPNWSRHFCLKTTYREAPYLKVAQLIIVRFSYHSPRTNPGSRNNDVSSHCSLRHQLSRKLEESMYHRWSRKKSVGLLFKEKRETFKKAKH